MAVRPTLLAYAIVRGVEWTYATLKTISLLFALSLAAVVRDVQADESGSGDTYVMDRDDDEYRREEDWWKNGDKPPF